MIQGNTSKKTETKEDILAFITNIRYCIESGDCKISFQFDRKNDANKDVRFTNRYTINDLFPNENPLDIMKRELVRLKSENYIETIKDLDFPDKSDLRVFGKRYSNDVYIKIRAELLSKILSGNNMIFVLSFHFSQYPFGDKTFPFKKEGS